MDKKDDPTDSQIIKLVVDGDTEQYSHIVKRYENKLMRYATYILKDYDIASDAVQETFIKAYINIRSFNRGKRFSPWIYRILHNEAMNVIKKSKKTVTIDAVNETNDDYLVRFNTDNAIDGGLLKREVRECLGRIDIKYQEVIVLSYFENLKYDEISDVLHIPTSTVGVRLKRGKEILKNICDKSGVRYE